MTTLAIIGEGIAGRSLLYSLAKSDLSFKRIIVFSAESFAPACSFNSTAVVASRGVSLGLSSLGDLLFESFQHFERHFLQDHPAGVCRVPQYSGAASKLDQFLSRFPDSKMTRELGGVRFQSDFFLTQEQGYLIDPKTYLDWLLAQSRMLPLEIHEEFITEVKAGKKVRLVSQAGQEWSVDKLVFCGGVQNRHWKDLFEGQKVASSKPVHGSYLEYQGVSLSLDSLSLTLDGDNFIYDKERGRLLLGSTTEDHGLFLTNRGSLKEIYQRLQQKIDITFPSFEEGKVRIGLREKASKREPYLCQQDNLWALGGLYKNGYSVGLTLAQRLVLALKKD